MEKLLPHRNILMKWSLGHAGIANYEKAKKSTRYLENYSH